ncbi:amino acid permease-domain-containing protein [Aspergillus pseudocaelatus]|uniref:Amino acid permease-domain-containing protein n=1 Tax=Aspergillus pseudocaelatus TaxID=1825620 RepID=A0ABQ6W6U9_9EURO|nr:amino acid permease-domain-containing protein [Aspergillus pseudocaelatus]
MEFKKDADQAILSPDRNIDIRNPMHADLVTDNADNLHRRLGNRQIQLLAIRGSIGTALFISIGSGLAQAVSLNLFPGWSTYSVLLGLVNNGIAEMTVLHPISGGFVRMAGNWVDEAFRFMAGWNFFLHEALGIPSEITALSLLSYWRNDIPTAAVILICILYLFTLVTMLCGNLQDDVYGFRYWRDPGPMAEYHSSGTSFVVVGPEWISIAAAEAKRPRDYVKNAFKTVYWRFAFFFIVGSIFVGIVVPYNDLTLASSLPGSQDGGRNTVASLYVIAMAKMEIEGLPHLTIALLFSSISSAGNTFTYCTTRTLYALALEGRAPTFLQKCTRQGVPVFCVLVVLCFAFLSFLQVKNGSAKSLTLLTNLMSAGGLIDYIVMCATYICFYRACQRQGVDKKSFPYRGWFQPYSAWIGLIGECTIVLCYGYTRFDLGDISSFITHYVIKRTKHFAPEDADLLWERPTIDIHEASFTSPLVGFWTEMLPLHTRVYVAVHRDRTPRSLW